MDTSDAYDHISEVNTWQDVRYDHNGNKNLSWPYPDKFERSEATGELAERIRTALAAGVEAITVELEYAPVYLIERTVSSGYSEYTQENMTYLRVVCGEHEHEIDPEWGGSIISELLKWLDEAEER